jgi:phosphatidylserine/phosphatidylglycerophosphate/cardiolipin synthase-like enzyme
VSAAAPTERHIHTRFGSRQVAELLQTIFAAELVAPSRCLWVVSPWISDVPILDNGTNAFSTLVWDWPRGRIRLSAILGQLLRRGTTVRIAARPIEHNSDFFARLHLQAGDFGERLRIVETETLHEKGILGDGLYLSGSMNITYSGLSFNDEVLHFFTHPETVAANRQLYTQWWGGEVSG